MKRPEKSGGRVQIRRPVPGTPPLPRVPEADRWTLFNGLRIVAVERRGLPQISLRLLVPAGAAADPSSAPGAAALTAALLTEGTERRTGSALHEKLDRLGAAIDAQLSHELAMVDLSTLSDTLPESLELLADVVIQPVFPEAEVERLRAEAIDGLRARLDEPANVADDTAAVALFGDAHPYGRLTSGTVEGLTTLERRTLVEFHQARYRPMGSTLVMAGDFDTESLRHLLEERFGDWAGATDELLEIAPVTRTPRAGERIRVEWPDSAQGEIRLVGPGLARSHPDWIPAALANYILGGSTITSRLGANLREEKGWTYGVRSGFAAGRQAAGWMIDTAVDDEATERAIQEIVRELERVCGSGFEEEELRRAQDAIALSLPRAFETPDRIVGRLATLEAYDLSGDYWGTFVEKVRAVTLDDVSRIAREHFDPRTLAVVSVGSAGSGESGGEA